MIATTSSSFLFWWLLLLLLPIASQDTCLMGLDGMCEAKSKANASDGNNNNNNSKTATSTSKEEKQSGSSLCFDKNEYCITLSERGECQNNPRYMNILCSQSCNICSDPASYDKYRRMLSEGSDLGVPQVFDMNWLQTENGTIQKGVQDLVTTTRQYMHQHIIPRIIKENYSYTCENEHEHCLYMALVGECTTNPTFMESNCAPVCQSCHVKAFEAKCPIEKDTDVWKKPGDLNNMFESIVDAKKFWKNQYNYQIKALSKPKPIHDSNATSKPWILSIDNFLTNDEADRLIELGNIEGFKPSRNAGKLNATTGRPERVLDNSSRTSSDAWCMSKRCLQDNISRAVMARISNITNIPEENSEFYQLVRYEEGQYYREHHDYIDHQVQRQQGVRILTVYLFLNNVKKGGSIRFTELGITVSPKRGRALIWPSVYNDKPNSQDESTSQETLTVEKGTKYGVNVWFHMRDFRTPFRKGCQ